MPQTELVKRLACVRRAPVGSHWVRFSKTLQGRCSHQLDVALSSLFVAAWHRAASRSRMANLRR